METNELHRGRLIDHLQLVVPDLARDPDGNNVEAVYHGPAQRSAASVRVTF